MHSKTHPSDMDLNSENHQPLNLCSHATLIGNVSKGSSKMDQNGLLTLWTNQKDSAVGLLAPKDRRGRGMPTLT